MNEDIRFIIDNDNEKWYATTDICKILKLSNVTETSRNIPDNFKKMNKIKTKGNGLQNTNTINTNGVKHILQSTRSIYKHNIINKLGLDLNIIYNCKEANVLRIISASFKSFTHLFQYDVDKYRIDLYFIDNKLAIEVDENNHKDRDVIYEETRQKYIEDKLGCEFIRFNPDEKNFNIGDIIHIILNKLFKL